MTYPLLAVVSDDVPGGAPLESDKPILLQRLIVVAREGLGLKHVDVVRLGPAEGKILLVERPPKCKKY